MNKQMNRQLTISEKNLPHSKYINNDLIGKMKNVFTICKYSHIKLHMEEGEKVKIKYYILDSKNKITNFMFMGHSH